jgi:hypothetical protein
MRKYEPIWNRLKSKDTTGKHIVVVGAPEPMHSRIIKGVLKEKNKDLGFKLLASEEGRWFRIEYASDKARLTITMKSTRITIGDL